MTDVLLQVVAVLLAALIVLQFVYIFQRRKDAAPKRSANGALPAPAAAQPRGEPLRATIARRAPGRGLLAWFRRNEVSSPPPPEPPVDLGPAATSPAEAQRLAHVRVLPGLHDARWVLAEALQRRSQGMTLDCHREKILVRHRVDALWHDGQAWTREAGEAAVDALQRLCGLEPGDASNEQRGRFVASFESARYDVTLARESTAAGPRIALEFHGKSPPLTTLGDLGLRPHLQDQLQKILKHGKGILLLSAVPGMGLRTTANVVLQGIDRWVRESIALEEETRRYPLVDNLDVKTYSAARGESAASLFDYVFDLEPDVVVLRDLPDGPALTALGRHLERRPCLAIVTVRARSCLEALTRVLKQGVGQALLARHVTAVLNQRLIRKRCPACPGALARPPERLLVGESAARHVQEACPQCGGLGYRGRTGLFELLVADEGFRRTLASRLTHESLRKGAASAGMLTLEQEGELLALTGITSPEEVARVVRAFAPSPKGDARARARVRQ